MSGKRFFSILLASAQARSDDSPCVVTARTVAGQPAALADVTASGFSPAVGPFTKFISPLTNVSFLLANANTEINIDDTSGTDGLRSTSLAKLGNEMSGQKSPPF
jgi:hypothetical protein